ncbi:MAG: hypothetical protein HGB03_00335 [Candidatus Yonathbacteria bacterium]|nr:hypothetical protein [Candidatus Yonathbacteria bacterium]NTW47714.1 hypothetical protein [Candidatus Yonathbacteria bacterium]
MPKTKTSDILSGSAPLVVHPYYSMDTLLKEAVRCYDRGYLLDNFFSVLNGMCFQPLLSSISTTLRVLDATEGIYAPKIELGDVLRVSKFGSYLPMEFILRYANEISRVKTYTERKKYIVFKTKPLPLPPSDLGSTIFVVPALPLGGVGLKLVPINTSLPTSNILVVGGINTHPLYE